MKKIYLDSCVILSFLQKDKDRFDTISAALDSAQRDTDEIAFFTSTITVVEVTRISQDGSGVTPGEFGKIEDFWVKSPIRQVDLNPHCASHGRKVMQRRLQDATGPELPKVRKRVRDLAHLGTAIWLSVDEYWTYDEDFGRYPNHQLTIKQPYVDQLRMPGV